MSRRRSSSLQALILQPPDWTGRPIPLYHGTTDVHVASILRRVDPQAGRRHTDFGRGFYTTTNLQQAWRWAGGATGTHEMRSRHAQPAVVRFELDRQHFARLGWLCFVRGDVNAEDYWSLVWHCRRTGGDHNRTTNNGWYDVVFGPVATDWAMKRTAGPDADQLSFHTPRAAALLDASNPREVPP